MAADGFRNSGPSDTPESELAARRRIAADQNAAERGGPARTEGPEGVAADIDGAMEAEAEVGAGDGEADGPVGVSTVASADTTLDSDLAAVRNTGERGGLESAVGRAVPEDDDWSRVYDLDYDLDAPSGNSAAAPADAAPGDEAGTGRANAGDAGEPESASGAEAADGSEAATPEGYDSAQHLQDERRLLQMLWRNPDLVAEARRMDLTPLHFLGRYQRISAAMWETHDHVALHEVDAPEKRRQAARSWLGGENVEGALGDDIASSADVSFEGAVNAVLRNDRERLRLTSESRANAQTAVDENDDWMLGEGDEGNRPESIEGARSWDASEREWWESLSPEDRERWYDDLGGPSGDSAAASADTPPEGGADTALRNEAERNVARSRGDAQAFVDEIDETLRMYDEKLRKYDASTADGAGAGPSTPRSGDAAEGSLEAAGDAVDSALSGPGQPSYPPFQIAPTEEDPRPVLVVVAGAKGSGADAIRGLAEKQLGEGKLVILGDADKPLEPAQHLEAAKQAIASGSNTILLTDGRDPKALAEDMKGFDEAGFRLHFAAAATQDPLCALNNLAAKIDPRFSEMETLATGHKLAEGASRAVGLGAELHVFEADERGWVSSAPLQPGERADRRIETACKAKLSDEMSLRSLARLARLAASTKDRAHHDEIRQVTADVLRASSDKAAESWGGVVGAAIDIHPRSVRFSWSKGFDLSAFNSQSENSGSPWHVDGRVRPDSSLKLTPSEDLEAMLMVRLRSVGKAVQEREFLRQELNDHLQRGPGKTAEEKRDYEAQTKKLQNLQAGAQDYVKFHGESVQTVLADFQRRAKLSPGKLKFQEKKAQEHKASLARTGIGYGLKPAQAPQQMTQPKQQKQRTMAGTRS
ncbi:hypothetical protein ACQEU8_35795 [Streptomyces sp. CA-250714]|uniref:hypothetical protein n=1 Tax=Streptomyces sp. CA-250714 TaxID=3240060 RepID=UPI003D8C5D0A